MNRKRILVTGGAGFIDSHVECDQIYNLACPTSQIHYQYDSIKTGRPSE